MALNQHHILLSIVVVLGLTYFDTVQALGTISEATCGEIIYVNKADSRRTIDSRTYTDNTEVTKCAWEIVAPSPYVILLSFSAFNLGDQQSCTTGNVTVESKLDINTYEQHGVFCGSTAPTKIVSVGSTIKITFTFTLPTSLFVADYDLDFNECAEYNGGCHQKCYNTIGGHDCGCRKGFALDLNKRSCKKDTCGGLIYGNKFSSGLITSPSFPNVYPNHKKCEWEIIAPPLHKILLNFTYFNLEGGNNCSYDNITIYSRLGVADFQQHGSYCGISQPPIIVSEGNVMRIEFSSDGSNALQGFVAYYHVIADECAEANGGCQHNCVNTLGGHQCSCRSGFALTNDKHACREVCGSLYFDFNGTISSPQFPENYPPYQSCLWNIVAPKGYRIKLQFYHFDLEDSKYCSADNLTLYSRESVEVTKLLGVFCGSELPPVIVSDTSNMMIMFKSDPSSSNSGFIATYNFVDYDECVVNNGGCQHDCCNTVGSYKCSCRAGFTLHPNDHTCINLGCSSNITTDSGTFTSVNYPADYPPNMNCIWHIETKAGHKIQLTMVDFDVEDHQKCLHDYVSIYDGDISDKTFKGKYCGTNQPHALTSSITTSNNKMLVEFRSDSTGQKKGFNATFTSVCGMNLTATSVAQDLYSHAAYASQLYKNNLLCIWYIEAPTGSTIRFRAIDFQLEGNCGYDYLQISEEVQSVNKIYGTYCGSGNYLDIVSQTNTLKILFKTDSSNGYRGFAAKYVIV